MTKTKDYYYHEIVRKARAFVEKGSTEAEAITQVCLLEPELYRLHKEAPAAPRVTKRAEKPMLERPGTPKAVGYAKIDEIAQRIRKSGESSASAVTRAVQTPEGRKAYALAHGIDADLLPSEKIAKAARVSVRNLERELVFKGVSRPRIDSAIAKFRRDLANSRQREPVRKRVVEVAKRTDASPAVPAKDWYAKLKNTIGIDRTIAALTKGDTPAPTQGTRGTITFDQALAKLRGQ